MHNLFLIYLSISTCFGRLLGHHQEKQLWLCDIWCLFCMDDCLVCRVCNLHTLHTRRSSIQNNKCHMSHKYSCFSWWWAHSRPKQVEKRNKRTKKNCAPSWLYLQDYKTNLPFMTDKNNLWEFLCNKNQQNAHVLQ